MAFSFANTHTQPAQTGGGLFGGLNTNTQSQTGGSLFGQTMQNQPAQQNTGLFGQPAQTQQPQQATSLFGQPAQQNTGFGQAQNQPTQQSSIFGQPQPQNQPAQQTSMFGQPQNQPAQQSSIFGQPQPQQPQQTSLFGQSAQQQPQQQLAQLGQLGSSQLWQPEQRGPQAQTVPEQMKNILERWSPNSPNCKFKYYFYNKVSEDRVPFYRAGPNEDPKDWDEALSKKPGPGYIPVLCTGFEQLGERIKTQQATLAAYNRVLHQINGSLDVMMTRHDTETSVRILNAKRKHTVLKQRSLALATKVQIMRNRGYAMDATEEALKAKLTALEKGVCDPSLSARAEEIWARMVGVRERARFLKEEMGKQAGGNGTSMDEETARRAEKILEDYATQLAHLKKELVSIHEEFVKWQKEQGPAISESKKR